VKVTTETTVSIVLTGKEAAELCHFLNQVNQAGDIPPVASNLLYTLREIPDDGEEVFPS